MAAASPVSSGAIEGRSLWVDAWRRLMQNRAAVVAGLILASMTLVVIVGPWLVPYEYDFTDWSNIAVGPDLASGHLFGTDSLGRDLLVRTERGVPATMDLIDTGQEGTIYGHFYDPTNPQARRFIWEQVKQGYYEHGIKVFWLDACEPEIKPRDFDNLRYHIGNGQAVTNLYPFYNAQAFYEGMRSEGETEIVNLCRSAWAGSQRFGAALWSGDIQSSFEALRAQLPAGLNAGLSGIPWWTTDIGGFFNGDIRSPYFRELIVRWFQYGLFCPLFRLHGYRLPYPETADGIFAGGPNEVWSFGEEAYQIIKELLFLRERLKPYIMAQMKLAHEIGTPPMRPLFFDFSAD